MMLKEIVLGLTEESKRDAVQKNLGQQVILNDVHEMWAHGVLLEEGYDNKVYQMKIADGREERELHYDDLNQLIVVSNSYSFLKVIDSLFFKSRLNKSISPNPVSF